MTGTMVRGRCEGGPLDGRVVDAPPTWDGLVIPPRAKPHTPGRGQGRYTLEPARWVWTTGHSQNGHGNRQPVLLVAGCQLPPTVAAWVAALLDVRGSFMVVRHRVFVVVTTTALGLLQAAAGRTKLGRIRQMRAAPGARHPRYEWSVTDSEAGQLLPAVRPWLLVKATHADLVLEVLQLKGSMTTEKGRPCPGLRPEQRAASVARLDAVRDELRQLNRSHSTGEPAPLS